MMLLSDFSDQEIVALIKNYLSDDLRKKKYQGNPNRFVGHCYVGSEAFYYIRNSKAYVPSYVKFENDVHWFITKNDGTIIDTTIEQFDGKIPPYHLKKNCGFLTKKPSKRTRILIQRINDEILLRQ